MFLIICEYKLLCRGKDSQGEDVIKPYTPTTLDSDVGYFELVIKVLILNFLEGERTFAFHMLMLSWI